MSDFCINSDNDINNLDDNFCINDFNFKNSTIIKPQPNKQKLAQKLIFVDSAFHNVENDTFTVTFDETIRDVVEIELMTCHLPPAGNSTGINEYNYTKKINYLLLFLEDLDLPTYKIASNSSISRCFARLPIPGKAANIFFGRIKNFTNVIECKPILQSLNKLKIKITDKNGNPLGTGEDALMKNNPITTTGLPDPVRSVQLTFGITYQTTPDLFDH
tara:strand:+ start:65 stop:715 length:651 start_codon:yes stop_codon:yes gene_type:complete